MKKINSIIIDDEAGNIIALSELLRQCCPQIVIQGEALNGEEGIELIKEVSPDLVFLDIEMPHGNAFQLLDKLSPVSFEVIFITAFDNYAIKAFKYAAVDYILKPVSIEELKTAVEKVSARLETNDINTRVNVLLDNLKSRSDLNTRIGLSTSEGYSFEDLGNITHLEAEGSYTRVYLRGKKSEIICKSLKEFEDILPDLLFCRVHHSHIINMNDIVKYYKGRGGYVQLTDGSTVEVAVRKKDDFFRKFRH